MSGSLLLSRRSFAALPAGTAVTPMLGWRAAAAGNPVVVELFTSQGCSSCPPADALFAELSRRPDLIALSFNIDYWNYLGWRDTLGSPDCSDRQRGYARQRGDGQVYTRQVVVNGRDQMVGSDRAAIAREIGRARAEMVPVAVASRGPEIAVEVAAAPIQRLRREATVWAIIRAVHRG